METNKRPSVSNTSIWNQHKHNGNNDINEEALARPKGKKTAEVASKSEYANMYVR